MFPNAAFVAHSKFEPEVQKWKTFHGIDPEVQAVDGFLADDDFFAD